MRLTSPVDIRAAENLLSIKLAKAIHEWNETYGRVVTAVELKTDPWGEVIRVTSQMAPEPDSSSGDVSPARKCRVCGNRMGPRDRKDGWFCVNAECSRYLVLVVG